MDAGYLLVAAGCLSAFVAAALAAHTLLVGLENRAKAAQLAQRAGAGSGLRLLQVGVPFLRDLATRAQALPRVRAFAELLCKAAVLRGVPATPEGALSCLLCGMLATVALCALLGRLALGFVLAGGLALLVSFRSNRAIDVQQERMRDALPDALQSMGACFGAGFTVLQTFEHLGREVKGPLGALFARAAQSLQTGVPIGQVLHSMRSEAGLAELSFVSVALAVQHQTGGSMQRVLDATRSSLKEELELRRSLRVHTAQAKLSVHVVVGVTLGLVVAMMLLSRDFLTPFLSSPAGMGMLAVAVGLQLAGIITVRSMLKMEVD